MQVEKPLKSPAFLLQVCCKRGLFFTHFWQIQLMDQSVWNVRVFGGSRKRVRGERGAERSEVCRAEDQGSKRCRTVSGEGPSRRAGPASRVDAAGSFTRRSGTVSAGPAVRMTYRGVPAEGPDSASAAGIRSCGCVDAVRGGAAGGAATRVPASQWAGVEAGGAGGQFSAGWGAKSQFSAEGQSAAGAGRSAAVLGIQPVAPCRLTTSHSPSSFRMGRNRSSARTSNTGAAVSFQA